MWHLRLKTYCRKSLPTEKYWWLSHLSNIILTLQTASISIITSSPTPFRTKNLNILKKLCLQQRCFQNGNTQINDNRIFFSINLFVYPCHYFYWCIFLSKQGWVEIYILINIYDMTMLWLKLNGNTQEICTDHSKWRSNCSMVIKNGFQLGFFSN